MRGEPCGGDSHIERMGVLLVVCFRGLKSGFGTSKGVKPQKVHGGSFCGAF